MDATNINSANVYAINSNEIFHYQPKRKINISNDDNSLSPYDKNFTYVLTFHPISPYTWNAQEKNESLISVGEFLEAKDTMCPNDFINTDNIEYLNLDAFDQWKDSTSAFYPILSLGDKCNYNVSTLEECEFLNCFTVFVYKGTLHWVINDGVSQPAKVHCTIDLLPISDFRNKYCHLILTRCANAFTMYLVLDNFSIFSASEPKLLDTIDNINILSDNFDSDDRVNVAVVDQTANLPLNTTNILKLGWNNSESNLYFTLDTAQSINFEILIDEKCKAVGVEADSYGSDCFKPIYTNDREWDKWGFNLYNESGLIFSLNTTSARINTRYLEAGTYWITVAQTRSWVSLAWDYSKCAFQSFEEVYNSTYTSNQDKWIADTYIAIRVNGIDSTSSANPLINNLEFTNIKKSVVYLNSNINISTCVGADATVCLGYLERHSDNILESNLLYKNSFKGYITEFSYFRDQVYFHKLGTLRDFNIFKYIVDYNDPSVTYATSPATSFTVSPTATITTNTFQTDQDIRNKVLLNTNKIPCITGMTTPSTLYTNMLWGWYAPTGTNDTTTIVDSTDSTGGSENYAKFSTFDSSVTGEGDTINITNIYNLPAPYVEYVTNFNIDDIQVCNGTSDKYNLPYQYDFTYNVSDVDVYKDLNHQYSNINYTGNPLDIQDLNTSEPSFCIFTFDIIKDVKNLSQQEVYDQVKFLMDGDYNLLPYDENITYEEYLSVDYLGHYIRATDFINNASVKYNILQSLNNYITSIANSIEKLYVTKFVINNFRDARNIFLYKISSNTDKRNLHTGNEYVTYKYAFYDAIDDEFSKLTRPWYTQFTDQIGDKYTFKMLLHQPQMDNVDNNPTNSEHYFVNGIHYTKDVNYNIYELYFIHTLDFYQSDFSFYSYDKIISGITPDVMATTVHDIIFDTTIYPTLQLIDQSRNIYGSVDATGSIWTNIDETLLDNNVLNIDWDLNNFYYMNLNNPSKPNQTSIIRDVNLFQGSDFRIDVPYTITKEGSQYKIEYDNSGLTSKSQFIATFNFPNNYSLSTKFKWALTNVVNDEYSLYTKTCNIYPDYIVNTKSVFVNEYDNTWAIKYAIRPTLTKKVAILNRNITASNFLYKINYFNRLPVIARAPYLNSFITYYNISKTHSNKLHIPINVTYDGTKRSISKI